MGPHNKAVTDSPSDVCECSVPEVSCQPSFLQVITKSVVERLTSTDPGDVTVQRPRSFTSVQLAPLSGFVLTLTFCVVPSTSVAQPDNRNAAAVAAAVARKTIPYPPRSLRIIIPPSHDRRQLRLSTRTAMLATPAKLAMRQYEARSCIRSAFWSGTGSD